MTCVSLVRHGTSATRGFSFPVFLFASEPYAPLITFPSLFVLSIFLHGIYTTCWFSASCVMAHINPANSLATAVTAFPLSFLLDNNR